MTQREYTVMITDETSDRYGTVGQVTDRRKVRAGHVDLDITTVGGDRITLDEDQTQEI